MAILRCQVCGRKQEVKGKKNSMADSDFHVCSRDCVFKWIGANPVSGGNIFESIAPHQYYYLSNERRPGGAYSSVLEQFFESNYEKYFAEALSSEGVRFLYEGIAFLIPSAKSAKVKKFVQYIPDFFLPDHKCFIEVKGPWRTGSRNKVKSFRAAIDIPLLVVSWPLAHYFYPEGGVGKSLLVDFE